MIQNEENKGDWLYINVDKHAAVRDFPTEDLMRSHWKECRGIALHEVVKPYELQDNTTEPAPRLRLPRLGTMPKQVSRKISKEMAKKLSKQLAELAELGSSKSNTCVNNGTLIARVNMMIMYIEREKRALIISKQSKKSQDCAQLR